MGKTLWVQQLEAMGVTIVLSVGMTALIAFALKAVMGLRVSEETESIGLDLAEHGEEGYHAEG